MRWIAVIIISLITSCSNSNRHGVGQFVYADCFGSIHVDRECASKLTDNPKTKEERMANMQGVSFIDTCKLTGNINEYNKFDFCPRCIDDDTYRHLSAIMERNQNKSE